MVYVSVHAGGAIFVTLNRNICYFPFQIKTLLFFFKGSKQICLDLWIGSVFLKAFHNTIALKKSSRSGEVTPYIKTIK